MRITRCKTSELVGPYDGVDFVDFSSHVADIKGETAFEQAGIMVPSTWGHVAADILARKYFRKSGIARALRKVEENAVPSWLWRSVPDLAAMSLLPENDRYGGENDARQVFGRIAGATTYWGWKGGYFSSEADARAFHDEICRMLAVQAAAPNSPQWFNTGLHWAYGIEGVAQGHHYVDGASNELRLTANAFERPQTHSCFIQTVADDLVNEGGILPLFVDEARIAKFGSGTGANFSEVRGAAEKLSGGGRACGLIAILRAGDRSASLVTANGSTRRSSKMVIVDADHPDIEAFVRWKADEERKVASLVTGSRTCSHHLSKIMHAATDGQSYDPATNPALKRTVRAARRAHVPENYIRRAMQFAKQGFTSVEFPVYDGDWDSEAYATVAGQNSNNTVRVTDAFLKAVETDGSWDLIARRGRHAVKTISAADLWDDIGHAVWSSADPGIHFATTINDWHTCPAAGEIRASNSCSEFLFLDDTGATLASVNLLHFKTEDGGIDLDYFEHACRLWTVALEISVSMAQYPSREIARRTHDYRPLGLGYANLGGLLMSSAIPYDSNAARALCGGLTAILSGVAYATSAEMARELGAFAGFAENREAMLRVIRNHGVAAQGLTTGYEGVSMAPVPLDRAALSGLSELGGAGIVQRAEDVWQNALRLGTQFGFRNAQASCIAPTGTIGLVMDCDTTGIEPDYALVKFKKLAGGGYFKIINRAVPEALRKLGYDDAAIADIEHHAIGHGSLRASPTINHAALMQCGFPVEKIEAVERALPEAFDVQFVFNKGTLGADFLVNTLKVPAEKLVDGFNLLGFLGFSKADIEAANVHVCGAMTLEGAPHLDPAHLTVFDCANPCGRTGTRYLSFESHIRMMASAQPFISGAISKTVNMPNDASVDDCKSAYMLSWKLGLKANALYRDGSKLSQPLSAHRLLDDEEDAGEEVALDTPTATITDQIRLIAQVAADEAVRTSSYKPDQRMPVRPGIRHVAVVDGQRVTLQTRLSSNGQPTELRIDAVGVTGRQNQLANDIAVAISLGLQHGVPLDQYVTAFTSRSGIGHTLPTRSRSASDIVEHVFQHLGVEYLGRHDLQAEPATERGQTA